MQSVWKGKLDRTLALFLLFACVVPYADCYRTRRRKAQALRGVTETSHEPAHLIPYDMMIKKTKSNKNKYAEKGQNEDEDDLNMPIFKRHGKKEQKLHEVYPTMMPSKLQGKRKGEEEEEENKEEQYPTPSPSRLQGKKRDEKEKEKEENEQEVSPTISPSQLQGKKREEAHDDEEEKDHAGKRPITRSSKSQKTKKKKKVVDKKEKNQKASKDEKSDEDEDDDEDKEKSHKKGKKEKDDDDYDGKDGDNEDGGEDKSPTNPRPTRAPKGPVSRPTLLPTTISPEERPGPPPSPTGTDPTDSPAGTNEPPAQPPNERPPTFVNTREFGLLDFVLTLAYPVNETLKLRDSMESIFYDGLLVDGLEAVTFPLPQPTNQRNVAQGYSFEDGQITTAQGEEVTLEQVHQNQMRLLTDTNFIESALRQRMNDPDLMILDLSLSEPGIEDTVDSSNDDGDQRRRLLLIAGLCSIACFILCVFVVHRRYQMTQRKVGEVVPEQDPHEPRKGPQTVQEEDELEEAAYEQPPNERAPEVESETGYMEGFLEEDEQQSSYE